MLVKTISATPKHSMNSPNKAYGSQLTDATQTQIALEEDATTITNFEPVVVPGLLQIAAYARAQCDDPGDPVQCGCPRGDRGTVRDHGVRGESGAVLLEGKTADLFLEEDDEIAAYQDTASRLAESALGADDSIAVIGLVLKEMA